MNTYNPSANRPVLRGPFNLFDNSIILEFISPPEDLDATVLIRMTLNASHPLVQKGKGHPFVPPLHIHFAQTESLVVVKGAFGVTLSSSPADWTPHDRVVRPEDGVVRIAPWMPHTLWPSLEARGEDAVMVLWASPKRGEEDMDHLFFETLFRYLDEGTKTGWLDPLQMMLLNDASASTLVLFPSAKFLGPLRWWVPWVLQSGLARVARVFGYTPLLDRFVKSE